MARAPALAEADELPEADRLLDYPHPRQTQRLYGQERAEQTLARSFFEGRMHHGWLLVGPEGVGKATLAYRFARFLLAAPEERDPFGASLDIDAETAAAHQVRALSHPGLFVLRRPYDTKKKQLKTEIPVDDVRRLRGFLHHTADGGAWRVVIVDTADEFNLNAANALLKSLEEPPARMVFILVSNNPGQLLPTIRSRCRTLSCEPLDDASLKKAVIQAMSGAGEEAEASVPAGEDWVELARLSRGSVRRLLSLVSVGGLDLYRRMTGLMGQLPAVDWSAVHALADELAGSAAEQRFELFFDLLLAQLAGRITAVSMGAAAAPPAAADLIAEPQLARWAELWETVVAQKAETQALNLDRKTLILDTFSRLARAART